MPIAYKHACNITCNAGYHVVGPAAVCLASGFANFQHCQGGPCAPFAPASAPAHGNLGSCAQGAEHGATCSFACDEQYVVIGANRTCVASQWTGADQTCVMPGLSF